MCVISWRSRMTYSSSNLPPVSETFNFPQLLLYWLRYILSKVKFCKRLQFDQNFQETEFNMSFDILFPRLIIIPLKKLFFKSNLKELPLKHCFSGWSRVLQTLCILIMRIVSLLLTLTKFHFNRNGHIKLFQHTESFKGFCIPSLSQFLLICSYLNSI